MEAKTKETIIDDRIKLKDNLKINSENYFNRKEVSEMMDDYSSALYERVRELELENRELLNGKTYDVKSLTKGSKLLFENYEKEIAKLKAFNKELIASLEHAQQLLTKARKEQP